MKTRSVTTLFCSLLSLSLLLVLTGPLAFAQQTADISSPSVENAQLLQFTAGGHVLGFTSSGMYAATGSHSLRVDFVGASGIQPQAEDSVTAEDPADPLKTSKAAPLNHVEYSNLWKGISLAYDASSGGILRSTYQLEAGADVQAIQLRYNAPLTVNSDGSLSIAFETGTLNEGAPLAWQIINGKQVSVAVSFTQNDNQVGFDLRQYDHHYPLTIDPTLTWNTFLGSSESEFGYGITVDGSGYVYVVGESGTANWGDSTVQTFGGGSTDAFVAKLYSEDGWPEWRTFLGGSGSDYGNTIAVDASSGNVYVAGYSTATWGAPVRAFGGGTDVFAAELNSSGELMWNTFLGGTGIDQGTSIALDSSNNVYVAGNSSATWSLPARAFGGDSDAFAAKLDSSGGLTWNTFLGGSGTDQGTSIVLDSSNNVYVAGDSSATWGAPVRTFSDGSSDAFAAKLDFSGGLTWNTFLGGSGTDQSTSIVLDSSNNVYVAGDSSATWGAPVRTFSGGDSDAFAAKLNSSGGLTWNAFLGGSGTDRGNAIALDSSNNVYVAGDSSATWGAPVRTFSDGTSDAFAAKLNSSGGLTWNTFLGGSGTDQGTSIALDSSNNIYVAGSSYATWGTPVNAYKSNADAFAASLNSSGALQWNTFFGGSESDDAAAIAVDISGNVYVAGYSAATWGLPVRAIYLNDAFVAKLDSSGALLWNTFLGGSGYDYGSTIAVDSSGNIYVAGTSDVAWGCLSSNCTQRAFTAGSESGIVDAFAAKLNSSGALQWNTFLGGSTDDVGYAIAVDNNGDLYVAGESNATWGSPNRPYNDDDAFAAKLNPDGTLLWNTFLGGSNQDQVNAIAVDSSFNIYVAGVSLDAWSCLPTACTVRSYSGGADAFAAKLNPSGIVQWNTFLGGTSAQSWSANDYGYAIAVDSSGIYVAGRSVPAWSCTPVACTVHAHDPAAADDAFAAKLDSNGVLLWNTFFGGGSKHDSGNAIAVDGNSNIYVAGVSYASWGSPARSYSGGDDAYAAKLNSSGALQWNTFLGGSGYDSGNAIAVDGNSNIYVAGESLVTWGSPVHTYTSNRDAFVAKLSPSDQPTYRLFLPLINR